MEYDIGLTQCSARRYSEHVEEAYFVTIDGRDGGMVARDPRDVWVARDPTGVQYGGVATKDAAVTELVGVYEALNPPITEGA